MQTELISSDLGLYLQSVRQMLYMKIKGIIRNITRLVFRIVQNNNNLDSLISHASIIKFTYSTLSAFYFDV